MKKGKSWKDQRNIRCNQIPDMQEIQLKENIDGLIGPPGGSPSTTSDMQVTQFNSFNYLLSHCENAE